MGCLVVSKTYELSRGERKNHKEFAGVLIFYIECLEFSKVK